MSGPTGKPRHAAFLLMLVAAACWVAVTIVTAIVRGEGHGPVFVTALVVLTLGLGGLLLSLRRILREAPRDRDVATRLVEGLLVLGGVTLAVGAFTDDLLYGVGVFLFLVTTASIMLLQRRTRDR